MDFPQAISKWRHGRFAEYEIYYAFALNFYPDEIISEWIPRAELGNCHVREHLEFALEKLNGTDVVFMAFHGQGIYCINTICEGTQGSFRGAEHFGRRRFISGILENKF